MADRLLNPAVMIIIYRFSHQLYSPSWSSSELSNMWTYGSQFTFI